MSITAKPPPIFRLCDEVFMNILKINANMFSPDEDALNTTRFTSQVCRTWRSSILDMPYLWAHMMDFNRLKFLRSTEWGQEIIRRSGDKPLWIQATSPWLLNLPPSGTQREFFASIIDQNWDRVQKLVLSGGWLTMLDRWKGPLYRPAAMLDMFHVQIADFPPNYRQAWAVISRRQPRHMYPDNDASLRYYFIDNIVARVPWLCNLHSIMLAPVYNISECLTVLSAIPNLQYLTVTSLLKSMTYFSHPVVSLPKLKHLKLLLNFDRMAFILDHIAIPHDCSLHLTAYWHGSIATTTTQILSTLSRASQPYFQSHPPRAIDISCLDSESGLITVRDDFHSKNHVFQMKCRSIEHFPDYMSNLSTALSLPEFASVTELQLHYDLTPLAVPDLSFLQYFSSVKILHTTEVLFSHITAQNHLPHPEIRRIVVFPKLQVVRLRAAGTAPCTVGGDTVKFILSRIEDGHPISVIDLTACNETAPSSPEIERLRSISGLKVIFSAGNGADGGACLQLVV
ncbi:hypothetical protein HYPSUDRAFT_200359 [Hypholoma sublateritium FD-334 SS-4]|uniref:F-box domain-containing protein n=1 Tax=Hypholoma sublateritium (strain FD-334 SS-4) TaxID=945553 RepID=A0A0D2P1M1_HYPSF|nr:hypothetical protein HYPSUDRAFT_200359 [Hypholoma sublateritium FD-334 SS-4]